MKPEQESQAKNELQNVPAQRLVIGAILQNPLNCMSVCRMMRVSKDWFIYPLDQLYELIETLYTTGQTIGLPVINQHFLGDETMAGILSECQARAGTVPELVEALAILRNNYGYRWLVNKLGDYQMRVDPAAPFDEFFDSLRSDIVGFSLTPEGKHDPQTMLSELEMRIKRAKGEGTWGIPSRWFAVNRMTAGYEQGKMSILAGRPKEGKTTLLLNEARHIAENSGPVDIYTMEMSEQECWAKMACDMAEMDFFCLKRGMYSEETIAKFKECWKRVTALPIWICDRNMSGEQLCGSMRDRSAKAKPVWRCLDHMGLIKSRRRAESRTIEVGHMSQMIVNTAKDTGCPVLVVCHLNRLATREKPTISHLRESGALEGDAYLVMLLYQRTVGAQLDDVPTVLDVAAHRSGPTGQIAMIYQKTKSRFAAER